MTGRKQKPGDASRRRVCIGHVPLAYGQKKRGRL